MIKIHFCRPKEGVIKKKEEKPIFREIKHNEAKRTNKNPMRSIIINY